MKTLIDVETIALDGDLSEVNELRARLDAAIADNSALASRLKRSQRHVRDLQRRLDTQPIDPRTRVRNPE